MWKLPKNSTSFIYWLKEWDSFYYVNVELFENAHEYSHVDIYQYKVMWANNISISTAYNKISWWTPVNSWQKLKKKELYPLDMMNDYMGWLKVNFRQVVFFLEQYKNMFEEKNEGISELFRKHALYVLSKSLEVAEKFQLTLTNDNIWLSEKE